MVRKMNNFKSAALITIKRTNADDKDFQSLVTLLDAELRQRDGEDHFFYAQFNSLEKIRHVVVAFYQDEAVGCGAYRPYDDDTVEIKRMFVSNSFRGRGIASGILNALEAWAQENDFRQCILETGFNQPEAIALYRKSGYTQMPNYGPYQEVTGSICMKKSLPIRY